MREIKFRVWNGTSMEYRVMAGYLGAFYVAGMDPRDAACMSPANTMYWKQTHVMQYTGLSDRDDSTEIYEGDIVWMPRYDKNARVQWNEYCAAYEVRGQSFIASLESAAHDGVNSCVVIGNIYETPDSLK